MEGPNQRDALTATGRHRRLSVAIDNYLQQQIVALSEVTPEERRLDRARLNAIFREHRFSPADFGLDLTVEGESELLLSLRLAHAEVKLVATLAEGRT